MTEIKSKVKSYENLNMRLDTLRKTLGESFRVVLPETRYRAYKAFTRTSLKPDKKGTLNEVAKSVSQYYKPITFDDFDVVLHPVVLEPVIQVVYEISVLYHLGTKNKYFIVGPVRDIKQLILR